MTVEKIRGSQNYLSDAGRLTKAQGDLKDLWVSRGNTRYPTKADVIRYLLDVYEGKEVRG